MEVIYTDRNRAESGMLHDFYIDFDTAGDMDFIIDVGYENFILAEGCWWYVEGTEYCGIVDDITVNTSEKVIEYSGRNVRGILNSYVIEPPPGEDYKVVSGALTEIVSELIADANLQDIVVVEGTSSEVINFQFNRYITLYEGLESLAKTCDKVISLCLKNGKVRLSFAGCTDYSDTNEYNGKSVYFKITKKGSTVNHLICLGQGELKDRTVIHLYADQNGNISDKQHFFGIEEREETYDNTSAATEEELRKGGIERLKELMSSGEFEVHTDDTNLKIGDIIGGYEEVTGYRIRSEITNIVAKIQESSITVEYTVDKNTVEDALEGYRQNKYYESAIASVDMLGYVKIGNIGQYENGAIYLTEEQSGKMAELKRLCS